MSSRIDNGEFTERGLARLIGVSQPQFHNVLKGKRKLQAKLADRILQKLEISILDLFHEGELREQLIARSGSPVRDVWETAARLQKINADLEESCPRKPSSHAGVRRIPVRDLAS